MEQKLNEEELAKRMNLAIKDLEFKRGCGVTLEKSQYIGDNIRDLEEELSRLKSPKSPTNP